MLTDKQIHKLIFGPQRAELDMSEANIARNTERLLTETGHLHVGIKVLFRRLTP